MAIQAKTFTASQDFTCGRRFTKGEEVTGADLQHLLGLRPDLLDETKPPTTSTKSEKDG